MCCIESHCVESSQNRITLHRIRGELHRTASVAVSYISLMYGFIGYASRCVKHWPQLWRGISLVGSEMGVKPVSYRFFVYHLYIHRLCSSSFPFCMTNTDYCHQLVWRIVSTYAGAELKGKLAVGFKWCVQAQFFGSDTVSFCRQFFSDVIRCAWPITIFFI